MAELSSTNIFGNLSVSGRLILPGPLNVNYSSTINLNLNLSQNFSVTLTGNTSITFSGLSENIGKSGLIVITQDSTGGRTFTLPSEAKTPMGGASIAQHTVANSISSISYYVYNTNFVMINYIGDYQ